MDSIEIYRGDALSLRKEYRTLQSDGLNDYCNDPLLPCSAASSSTPSPQLLEKNIGFCSLDQGSQLAHFLALVSNMSNRGGVRTIHKSPAKKIVRTNMANILFRYVEFIVK